MMGTNQIKVFNVKELSLRSGKSVNSLNKRCARALKQKRLMRLENLGYFFVAKPGKGYQLIKPDDGYTEKQVEDKFLKFLIKMKGFVCEECAANVVDKIIQNIKEG